MTTVDEITPRPETPRHDGKPPVPPPVDLGLAPANRSSIDRAIDTIGLPYQPGPAVVAAALRDLAKQLERDGTTGIKAASFLAARGWPTATLGDGTGSRSTSTSTSVERAARADADDQDPGHWDNVDVHLHTLLRVMWLGALNGQAMLTDLLAHGDDIDDVPVAACECCERLCDRRKGDRLRSGYCNACRMAWARAGCPERTDWAHARRHQLRDGQAGMCVRCDRPWTAEVETLGTVAS